VTKKKKFYEIDTRGHEVYPSYFPVSGWPFMAAVKFFLMTPISPAENFETEHA
jgi:hypothetical protein